ncbi:response regulator transcription factor [Adlercreutzia aquisgranensis]|uniref:response regulator transcription factor n=1 Tax=Adlercreutzia aquisgranensis TaxID=2941323 RepID=UPI00204250C5|nr:LuxR C-terminal-related transcriptional regulator [Adlercreutzia aquisgranensis]
MLNQLRQIFALVVPQGADRRIRYCGVQMICLVMVWFFIQGSGGIAFVDANQLPNGEATTELRLLTLASQCGGGIIGSLVVLFGARLHPDRAPADRPTASAPSKRTALICSALLALSLVGCFACSASDAAMASAVLRAIACSVVTVLFLNACLVLVGFSLHTALAVFLLVSLCRIVQNLIMLPFEMGFAWAVLSLVAELVLVGTYAVTVDLAERTAAPSQEPPSPSRQTALEDAPTPQPKRFLPWQFIVHVMLYYFVIGVLRLWEGNLAAPGLQTNCSYLLASTAAFALFYASFVRTGNTSDYWVRIRQIAFPLLVAAAALTGILPFDLLFLAVIMGQTAYRFYLLASYVEMFSICAITDVNARHVFAVTHIVMYVGMFAGSVLGMSTQTAVMDPTTVLGITLLLFLCLIAASCWLGNDKSAGKVWGRRIELTPRGRHDQLLTRTCQAIADEYRLTAKETEILEHLVRKQTLDQIADALVVSKNTVRTHVRNLYAKIGAHSQSDVYRLFDQVKRASKR